MLLSLLDSDLLFVVVPSRMLKVLVKINFITNIFQTYNTKLLKLFTTKINKSNIKHLSKTI